MTSTLADSVSLRALLRGAIDYAGLFPPAGLGLAQAVENYRRYRNSPEAWALGRFVVPAERLPELAALLQNAEALPLSVLLSDSNPETLEAIARWGARVESLEARAPLLVEGPPTRPRYVEVPLDGDFESQLDVIAAGGAYAKVRTGGTTPAAFPTPERLARFLAAAAERGLPFKATAGLHHPLRGSYRLSYEPGAPSGVMYGFLNLLLAAGLAWRRAAGGGEELLAALLESDPSAIRAQGATLRWRQYRLEAAELSALRDDFVHSFGSCSFEEPLGELAAGGWL